MTMLCKIENQFRSMYFSSPFQGTENFLTTNNFVACKRGGSERRPLTEGFAQKTLWCGPCMNNPIWNNVCEILHSCWNGKSPTQIMFWILRPIPFGCLIPLHEHWHYKVRLCTLNLLFHEQFLYLGELLLQPWFEIDLFHAKLCRAAGIEKAQLRFLVSGSSD